jgi:hypothetical protein
MFYREQTLRFGLGGFIPVSQRKKLETDAWWTENERQLNSAVAPRSQPERLCFIRRIRSIGDWFEMKRRSFADWVRLQFSNIQTIPIRRFFTSNDLCIAGVDCFNPDHHICFEE